jgi:hypothetical protein
MGAVMNTTSNGGIRTGPTWPTSCHVPEVFGFANLANLEGVETLKVQHGHGVANIPGGLLKAGCAGFEAHGTVRTV